MAERRRARSGLRVVRRPRSSDYVSSLVGEGVSRKVSPDVTRFAHFAVNGRGERQRCGGYSFTFSNVSYNVSRFYSADILDGF
jgi:hypothetical protein